MNSLFASPAHLGGVPVRLCESTLQAGFPSPAEDSIAPPIDLLRELAPHPDAVFCQRVRGESMRGFGIFDGDFVLIDRAIEASHGDIVVAEVDTEFTLKAFHCRGGVTKLRAGNESFPDIVLKDGQELSIWGVVVANVRPIGRRRPA